MNFKIIDSFKLEKTSKIIKSNKLLKCLKTSIFSPLHVVAAKLNINILKSSDVVGLKRTKYSSLEYGSPDGGVQKYNTFKSCLSRNKVRAVQSEFYLVFKMESTSSFVSRAT